MSGLNFISWVSITNVQSWCSLLSFESTKECLIEAAAVALDPLDSHQRPLKIHPWHGWGSKKWPGACHRIASHRAARCSTEWKGNASVIGQKSFESFGELASSRDLEVAAAIHIISFRRGKLEVPRGISSNLYQAIASPNWHHLHSIFAAQAPSLLRVTSGLDVGIKKH